MQRTGIMILLLIVTNAQAAPVLRPTQNQNIVIEHLKKKPQPYQIQLSSIDYQYKEIGHMNLTGRLVGMEGAYESHLLDGNEAFFRGDVSLNWGTTVYDGGLQDSEGNVTPYQSDSKEFISILRFLLGRHVYSGPVHRLSLYGGFGYWDLSNQMQGVGSYRRNASYNYLPIGLSLNSRIASGIALFAKAEYNVFLRGKTKSHLEDVDSDYPTLTHEQKKGAGYKASIGANYSMIGYVLQGQLYHQAWDIDKSDVQFGYVEPANTTKMTGLSLGIIF